MKGFRICLLAVRPIRALPGLAVGLLLAIAAGCASPCCSTGWRIEVGRPGTVSTPAIYTQPTAGAAINPLAAYPAIPAGQPVAGHALAAELAPAPRVLAASPPAGCTLDAICNALDRIERRLINSARPMPSAQE